MATGQSAKNLEARRVTASLTPDQLAQRSGLSLRAVLRAEYAARTGGGAVLSSTDIARLAATLSTTPSDIRG
jgi:hypothetical protein